MALCGTNAALSLSWTTSSITSITAGGLRWQKKQIFNLEVFIQCKFNEFLHNLNKQKKMCALNPSTNVALWTGQASQNRADGYWYLLSAEWLIPLCFNTHFCFCFLMLSFSSAGKESCTLNKMIVVLPYLSWGQHELDVVVGIWQKVEYYTITRTTYNAFLL